MTSKARRGRDWQGRPCRICVKRMVFIFPDSDWLCLKSAN